MQEPTAAANIASWRGARANPPANSSTWRTARGIVLATQAYGQGEPVNLGAGFEISIRDLAEKIRRLVGLEGELVWDASKPDNQPRRCLDTFRAARLVGFGATVAPDEGLRRTVD